MPDKKIRIEHDHAIELHSNGGEWAALYVDGVLYEGPGDAYHSDEALQEMFGVKVVCDSNFMRGGTQRSDAAQTVDEIHEYDARLSTREAQIRALEDQIEALKAEPI